MPAIKFPTTFVERFSWINIFPRGYLPFSGAQKNGKIGFCSKAPPEPKFSWVFVHGNAQNLVTHLLVPISSLYLNQEETCSRLNALETSNFSNGHRILRSSGKSWEISWKTPYNKYFRWCKFRLLTNLCQVKTFVYWTTTQSG
jgi:hypothetical protein